MKKSIINTAIFTALSVGTVAPTQADILNYSFNGYMTWLDNIPGNALLNTSNANGSNQFQTPINGTFAFDNVTGAGTVDVAPFEFLDGQSPFIFTSFNLQSIGDGMGGSGTLVLGNMLFNWNTNTGIPSSIVLDAAGFFNSDLNGGGAGSVPASDGIYVGDTVPNTSTGPNGYAGYLALGPIPIATTAWNTTDNCTSGADCFGKGTSGVLPLLYDNAASIDYDVNTGGNIGGTPMLDGPFQGSSFNFDITDMTFLNLESGTIFTNCDFAPDDLTCFGTIPEVPLPTAIWLFGSGLLGLIGFARRKA